MSIQFQVEVGWFADVLQTEWPKLRAIGRILGTTMPSGVEGQPDEKAEVLVIGPLLDPTTQYSVIEVAAVRRAESPRVLWSIRTMSPTEGFNQEAAQKETARVGGWPPVAAAIVRAIGGGSGFGGSHSIAYKVEAAKMKCRILHTTRQVEQEDVLAQVAKEVTLDGVSYAVSGGVGGLQMVRVLLAEPSIYSVYLTAFAPVGLQTDGRLQGAEQLVDLVNRSLFEPMGSENA